MQALEGHLVHRDTFGVIFCNFWSFKTVDFANILGDTIKTGQFFCISISFVHCFVTLFPNYVANHVVFVSNFMSRITQFWCHILVRAHKSYKRWRRDWSTETHLVSYSAIFLVHDIFGASKLWILLIF